MDDIDTELVSFIVTQLSKGTNPNDIVLELCRRSGMDWSEAKALVEQVREEQGRQIARRQSPLLGLLALATLLAGLFIAFRALYALASRIDLYLQVYPEPLNVFSLLLYLVRNAPGLVAAIVLGAAMVAGSATGVRRLMESLF